MTSEHASTPDLRPAIRWAAGIVVMAMLFLWWPYQPWTFSEKVSVLIGWARILAQDQSGEWIFCPFVPLLSVALAWRHRRQLAAIPLRGHASGIAILIFGAGVFWAGYRAGTGYPGFAATQLVIAGLLVWLCGWPWMRVLFFPWLFLVFMWPGFPLEAQLAVPLRLLAASTSARLLGFLDLPAISQGTALLSMADPASGLPEGARFKLDVAAACSGMRALYALMMTAAFTGYWFLGRWIPRCILFLSALPLALAGNVVRLLLLALATVWFGEEFAVGSMTAHGEVKSWFHDFAGLSVYAVALSGIFALTSVLERWNRRAETATSPSEASSEGLRATSLRAGGAVAFGVAVLAWCGWSGRGDQAPEPGVRLNLPGQVGSANGRALPMTEREQEQLGGAGVSLVRRFYQGEKALPKQVTVVLDGPGGRGLHRPEICAVAQAWRITGSETTSIVLPDRTLQGTLMHLSADAEEPISRRKVRHRAVHIFWYQGGHQVSAPTEFGSLLHTYMDRVLRNRNHRWALVSFSTYLPPEPLMNAATISESAAIAELKDFVQEVAPGFLLP